MNVIFLCLFTSPITDIIFKTKVIDCPLAITPVELEVKSEWLSFKTHQVIQMDESIGNECLGKFFMTDGAPTKEGRFEKAFRSLAIWSLLRFIQGFDEYI